MPVGKNQLYFGDNLEVLRHHDLIYLDPPFNSKANYNVLYKERTGRRFAAQVQTFEDIWWWGPDAAAAFDDILTSKTPAAGIILALHSFLGATNLMAYLTMMAVRLIDQGGSRKWMPDREARSQWAGRLQYLAMAKPTLEVARRSRQSIAPMIDPLGQCT